jgi:hypothetical protein
MEMSEPTTKPSEPAKRPQDVKAQGREVLRQAVRWSWAEVGRIRRAYEEGARSVDDKERKA